MKRTQTPVMRSTGFTLIEVMITVAIIGILAAIAVPSYSNYLIRARIPDATSTLAAKRVQLEQYFQDNYKYSATAPACASDTTSSPNFTFSCASASDTEYTLQAVGKNSMAAFTFTVDQDNVRATTVAAGGPSGWTGNTSCWVTNKGGAC